MKASRFLKGAVAMFFVVCAEKAHSSPNDLAFPDHIDPQARSAWRYALARIIRNPLPGFVTFCRENPAECSTDASPVFPHITPERFALIQRINNEVNRLIEPVRDIVQHGLQERWDMARTNRGDCEEFSIVKAARLREAGLPASALLFTFVEYQNGAVDPDDRYHLVLTIRTSNMGDIILNNLTNDIVRIDQSGFSALTIQDPSNRTQFREIAGMVRYASP